jgi:hypothetical protein
MCAHHVTNDLLMAKRCTRPSNVGLRYNEAVKTANSASHLFLIRQTVAEPAEATVP